MKAITNTQDGGYEPVVKLADGSTEKLSAYVKQLNEELTAQSGDVAGALHLNEGSASSAVSAAAFAFSAGSPPARVLFAPSLEDLGYDAAEYKMQAIAVAHVRSNNPPAPAQLRVVDAAGEAISGSTVDATITADTTDQVVTSQPFDITPGQGYALDIRLITADGGTTTVTLHSKNLIVRIVKL